MIGKYKFDRLNPIPLVGFCYQAAEMHQGGRRVRSLSEGQAVRAIVQTADRVQYISLNHSCPLPYPVITTPFASWEETAGLIHNLDAVVTVDTSILWLASAMRKPVALLASGNSDWKILRKSNKFLWGDNVRIFQNEGHGLENAIDQYVAALRQDFDSCFGKK